MTAGTGEDVKNVVKPNSTPRRRQRSKKMFITTLRRGAIRRSPLRRLIVHSSTFSTSRRTVDGMSYTFDPSQFSEILSFHDGVAAVCDRQGFAYHIHEKNGEPLYAARFARTFGFYAAERAAVTDFKNKSFHINYSGEPVYSTRYGWCGNFIHTPAGAQTVVRDVDTKYFVVDKDGRVVCGPYRYAGDPNSSGNRVVWDFDNHCSIVNSDGSSWFKPPGASAVVAKNQWIDAKVPHKGIAAVKDAGGWYFVDNMGQQVGKGRFEEVEPHYNGQSRVKLFNGEWAVVDEFGGVLLSLGLSKTAGALELESLSKQWWQALALKKILATNVLHGDDNDTLGDDPRLRSILLDTAAELGLLRRTKAGSESAGGNGFSLLTKGTILSEENATSDRCRYWLQDRYLRTWLQYGTQGDEGGVFHSFGTPPSRFLQPGD